MDIFTHFSLLNVAASVSLLCLIIPLLIHLFNPSKGKIVLVGNIALIKALNIKRVNEIKLTQLFLLILRLCIFTLICLWMMQLFVTVKQDGELSERILLHPSWLSYASDGELHQLSALITSENRKTKLVVILDKKLKKLDDISFEYLKELSLNFKQSIDTNIIDNPSIKNQTINNNQTITTLLAELESTDKEHYNNIIYATNQAELFGTQLVSLHQEYQWKIKTLAAEQLSSLTPVEFEYEVAIYRDEERAIDALFLQTALQYLSNKEEFNFTITSHVIESDISFFKSAPKRLIFWLSELPVTEQVFSEVRSGSLLIEDMRLSERSDNKSKTIFSFEQSRFDFFQFAPLTISIDSFETILTNNQGDNLLVAKKLGNGKYFKFNDRFNSTWNNWVTNVEFPIHLNRLFFSSLLESKNKAVSKNQISQLLKKPAQQAITSKSLASWLLLIISGLWLLERLVATRWKVV